MSATIPTLHQLAASLTSTWRDELELATHMVARHVATGDIDCWDLAGLQSDDGLPFPIRNTTTPTVGVMWIEADEIRAWAGNDLDNTMGSISTVSVEVMA